MIKTLKFNYIMIFIFISIFIFSNSGFCLDFKDVRKNIKETLKNNNNEIQLGTLGYGKATAAGQMKISKVKYFESEKEDMIILTGRGKLPVQFNFMKNIDSDVVVTIKPDAATNKGKDLVMSLTAFYDSSILGKFYKKMDKKNIFRELLSGKNFISHSNRTQNLSADQFPPEVKKKFAAVLNDKFLITLQDGVMLYSDISFNPENKKLKDFAEFCKMLNIDRIGAKASIFLSPDWKHITLKLLLGDGIKMDFLPKQIKSTTPYVYINLSEIGLGFEMDMKMDDSGQILKGIGQTSLPILLGTSKTTKSKTKKAAVPKSKDPVSAAILNEAALAAEKAFAATELPTFKKSALKMLGALRGTWNNAFGFKNFTLYDLVVKTELPLWASGVTFGLGGRMDVGDIKIDVGAVIPVGYSPSNAAYKGKVSKVPLGETFKWLTKLNKNSKKKKSNLPLESLFLKDVMVSVAAQDDRDLNIQAGVKYAGSLHWDKQELGHIDLRTSHGEQEGLLLPLVGLRADGWIRKFKLGPLELSGKGVDGKYGTDDDGPFIDLAYGTKLSDHLKFSAIISLFKEVQVETEFSVGYGFHFKNWRTPMKNKTNLFISTMFRERFGELGEMDFSIVGKASLYKPSLVTRMCFTENFYDELLKFSTKTLDDAVKGLTEQIAEARENVEAIKPDFTAAKNEVDKGMSEFEKQAKKIEKKITEAKNRVSKLKKKLKKRKNQLKDLPWNKFKRRTFLISKIAKLKTLIVSAETAYEVISKLKLGKNSEKIAKNLKELAEKKLTEIEEQLKDAQANLSLLMKTAEDAKKLSATIEKFGKNFIIEEIGYEGDMGKIVKGKLPEFFVKSKLYGKSLDFSTDIYVKDIDKTMWNILKKAIDEFAKKDKKIGKPLKTLIDSM